MVSKSGIYYQCDICFFKYKDEKTAKECEAFCKENNACSIEITKLAVKGK